MSEANEANKANEIRLGNLFGGTGGNWAGMVYDKDGIAPTILTMSGGGRQPHIIVIKKKNEQK